MIKAYEIQDRLIQFAARIITLCDTLPLTTAGQHIAAQLLRSGTTPALNHVAARTPETRTEILNYIKSTVAALDESEFWLSIIIASDMLPQDMLAPLITDCQQLSLFKTVCLAGVEKVDNFRFDRRGVIILDNLTRKALIGTSNRRSGARK